LGKTTRRKESSRRIKGKEEEQLEGKKEDRNGKRNK
jgi:hypothetical protein